ncbi:uncharacterized protein CCOS01_16678, partial [Colletotrichum costaricense]
QPTATRHPLFSSTLRLLPHTSHTHAYGNSFTRQHSQTYAHPTSPTPLTPPSHPVPIYRDLDQTPNIHDSIRIL